MTLCSYVAIFSTLSFDTTGILSPLQRSYSRELFDDAVTRMKKAGIKTDSEIERFLELQSKVQELVRQKHQQEVDYGDIPDEFRGE